MPPSRQIANELRDRITSGDLPAGARLPSITMLMQMYGVARNTARRSLAILEDENLIEIVHGWGSFVKTLLFPSSDPVHDYISAGQSPCTVWIRRRNR